MNSPDGEDYFKDEKTMENVSQQDVKYFPLWIQQ